MEILNFWTQVDNEAQNVDFVKIVLPSRRELIFYKIDVFALSQKINGKTIDFRSPNPIKNQ